MAYQQWSTKVYAIWKGDSKRLDWKRESLRDGDLEKGMKWEGKRQDESEFTVLIISRMHLGIAGRPAVLIYPSVMIDVP